MMDPTTLFYVSALTSLFFGVGIILIATELKGHDRKGLIWGIGNIIRFISYLLFATGNIAGPFLSVIAANLLLTLAEFFHLYELRLIFKQKNRYAVYLLVLLFQLGFFFFFTFIKPNVAARVLFISLFFALILTFEASLIFNARKKHLPKSYLYTILGLLLVAGIMAYRAILYIVEWDIVGTTLDQEHAIFTGIAQLGVIVEAVVVNFGFTFILTHDLIEDLDLLANRDALTGILNRRATMLQLKKAFEQYKRTQTPASIIAIDIDNLKQLNDRYGHFAGDEGINAIVKAVQSEIRINDDFGRVGGDEFLLLLNNAKPDKSLACIERIKAKLDNLPFEYEGMSMLLSASIGFTNYSSDDTSYEEAVSRADESMYEAKKEAPRDLRLV